MQRMLFAGLFAVLLSGCVMVPAHEGQGYVVAPALPLVVELGVEPYYYHSGFYYYYHDQRWSYARERSGPWQALPRDRYPREIRFKNRDGRGQDRGHDDRERN